VPIALTNKYYLSYQELLVICVTSNLIDIFYEDSKVDSVETIKAWVCNTLFLIKASVVYNERMAQEYNYQIGSNYCEEVGFGSFPKDLFNVTMYSLSVFSNYKVIFTNAENIHEICCNNLVSQEIAQTFGYDCHYCLLP